MEANDEGMLEIQPSTENHLSLMLVGTTNIQKTVF